MRSLNLRLMFPIKKVDYWARRYPDFENDTIAFEAGKRIREGDYSRANLTNIVKWKSHRRAALIAGNTDEEIWDALRLAVMATEPRSALAVLMGLCGVALPMASSILTAIDQEVYTVTDYRAMEALGEPEADYYNLNMYLHEYLPTCRRLAAEAGVSLRMLDRALWTWSENRGIET